MAKDAYRYFRIEARELLDSLAKGVLDLDKGSAGEGGVPGLLRLAHTLKGAARVVKQAEIADLIHGVEDTLTPYRDLGMLVPRAQVDSVLAAVDAMNARLALLTIPQEAGPVAEARVPDAPLRMARVDIVEVDVVLEGLGEVGSELAALRRVASTLEKTAGLASQWSEQMAASSASVRAMAEEVQVAIAAAQRSMVSSVERIDRELRQARDAAEKLRLVPVATVFNTLERSARDAAHSVGKQVVFEASGGDVRIDAEVLDSVQTALVQLVRNAVAHGIEPVAQRQAHGKAPAGRVTLEVIRRGYHVWFRCQDDGGGVDLEAVRRAILRKGAVALDTHGLTATDLIGQLLKGGITTAPTITELAGRGIGLDVVREVVQRLNGEVTAETSMGSGTMFELRVPMSLASLNVLMVEAGGQVVAIPLDAVKRTLRVFPADIVHSPQGMSILHEEKLIPLAPLTLGLFPRMAQASNTLTVVVVASAGELVAVTVTRLCGMDTVVLRPLPALAPAEAIVLGMHLDTEGNPRMVLDPEQFGKITRLSSHAAPVVQALRPILIIDDSLTTRMLESSILESAGFTVELATSAEEGLDMAKRNPYALFLVDVEMPGMDGFGFVEHARADPGLRDVPSILVTSRDSAEDRQRGLNAGACAYIVKGEFDQVDFLQRIMELVTR